MFLPYIIAPGILTCVLVPQFICGSAPVLPLLPDLNTSDHHIKDFLSTVFGTGLCSCKIATFHVGDLSSNTLPERYYLQ